MLQIAMQLSMLNVENFSRHGGCNQRLAPDVGHCYEFIRISTHPRVFHNPFSLANAWAFIQAVLSSPSLSMLVETERHSTVVTEVFNQIPAISGNLVFDAHTAILMKEHGVKTIYTRDTDFHRFPFLTVVDPLQK